MSAQVSPMLSTDELLNRIKHAYRKAEDGRATYEKLIPEWYDKIGDRRTAASILENELGIGRSSAYRLLPAPPKKDEEKQDSTSQDETPAYENIEDLTPDPTPEVEWRRGLIFRAKTAAADAAYEDWSGHKVDREVVEAAYAAAAAWETLGRYLEELHHGKR